MESCLQLLHSKHHRQIYRGFSMEKSQGPLCPHLCLNLQLQQDPWSADVWGKSTQTQPFAGISSLRLQPFKTLESRLKKQPHKSHEDNNPVALLKKEAVEKGLWQKPNQFSIKEWRNKKQSLPSSPYPHGVFYLVGVEGLAQRQGSPRYIQALLIKKRNPSN